VVLRLVRAWEPLSSSSQGLGLVPVWDLAWEPLSAQGQGQGLGLGLGPVPRRPQASSR